MQRNRIANKDFEYYMGLPDLEVEGDEYEDLPSAEEEFDEGESNNILSWKEIRSKYGMPDYDELTEGWFSLTYPMSFNRLMPMCVGPRSLGKTTGCALWLLKYYLSHLTVKRNGWMYVRRDKDEVEETAHDYFSDACAIINGYITNEEDKINVVYEGGRYKLNGRFCGISVSLKKQQKLKSKNLSWAKYEVYDEAITQSGKGYIGGFENMELEYDYLQALAISADREVGNASCDEVVTIVLANAESANNPMYRGTGADKYIRDDSHKVAPKDPDCEWVLYLPTYDDCPKAKKMLTSRRMKLQRTTVLEKDYGIRNTDKHDEFIRPMKGQMTPIANMTWEGIDFTFYSNHREGLFYMKRGECKAGHIMHYALTLEDHRPNYCLVTAPSKLDMPIYLMKKARKEAMLYFEDRKIQQAVDTFLKFIV